VAAPTWKRLQVPVFFEVGNVSRGNLAISILLLFNLAISILLLFKKKKMLSTYPTRRCLALRFWEVVFQQYFIDQFF
jgi:hypothetical protein